MRRRRHGDAARSLWLLRNGTVYLCIWRRSGGTVGRTSKTREYVVSSCRDMYGWIRTRVVCRRRLRFPRCLPYAYVPSAPSYWANGQDCQEHEFRKLHAICSQFECIQMATPFDLQAVSDAAELSASHPWLPILSRCRCSYRPSGRPTSGSR